ncbi:Receptor-type tyrosine-protein phosphatase gamma [Tupaia chinensis]|uniref:Receptor-type tyrosine-protein phosphatase gamma n=1 Tax=Tupaia chinensis TaxID=246437 RepID=L9JEA4_TUPCH|nr:Receptor-type tyrosine-protein phosphatase gamma [Tupaia chinensis]
MISKVVSNKKHLLFRARKRGTRRGEGHNSKMTLFVQSAEIDILGEKTIFLPSFSTWFISLTEGYVGALHENRHGSSVQIRRRKASGDPYWAYSGDDNS